MDGAHEGQPWLLPAVPATHPAAGRCCLAHALGLWDILRALRHLCSAAQHSSGESLWLVKSTAMLSIPRERSLYPQEAQALCPLSSRAEDVGESQRGRRRHSVVCGFHLLSSHLCTSRAFPAASSRLPFFLWNFSSESWQLGSAVAQVCQEPSFLRFLSKAWLFPHHKAAYHAENAWALILGCPDPFAEPSACP